MPSSRPLLIYLAIAMDDVSLEQARRWRETAPSLADTTVAFFSPAHAYLGANKGNFPAVDGMNRAAILQCDGMVADIRQGRSFGTIREIEFAVSLGKPSRWSARW